MYICRARDVTVADFPSYTLQLFSMMHVHHVFFNHPSKGRACRLFWKYTACATRIGCISTFSSWQPVFSATYWAALTAAGTLPERQGDPWTEQDGWLVSGRPRWCRLSECASGHVFVCVWEESDGSTGKGALHFLDALNWQWIPSKEKWLL